MVGRDRGFKTRTGENGSFFVTAVVYDRDSIGEGKKGRAERERRKVERAHTDNWLVKGPREPVDGVEQEFPTRAPLVLAFRSKPRAYDLTDRCVLPLATVTQSRMELTYAIYMGQGQLSIRIARTPIKPSHRCNLTSVTSLASRDYTRLVSFPRLGTGEKYSREFESSPIYSYPLYFARTSKPCSNYEFSKFPPTLETIYVWYNRANGVG